LQFSAEISAGIALACLVLSLPACDEPEPAIVERTLACGHDGALVAEIYGGVRASITWDAAALECEGTPRPNAEGARLRFAGKADGERQLAFILGLPDLVAGETATELPTNVTLIEEGTGRYFGTRDTANCWTDIDVHEQIQAAESMPYRFRGILYCVAPLAKLNGNSSISFADLKFTGRLDWGVQNDDRPSLVDTVYRHAAEWPGH